MKRAFLPAFDVCPAGAASARAKLRRRTGGAKCRAVATSYNRDCATRERRDIETEFRRC